MTGEMTAAKGGNCGMSREGSIENGSSQQGGGRDSECENVPLDVGVCPLGTTTAQAVHCGVERERLRCGEVAVWRGKGTTMVVG
jgi:hypothetical protein